MSGPQASVTVLRPNQPLTVQLELRSVYGAWKVYPFCANARGFAEVAGTTTLTGRHLNAIQRMGYRLQVMNGICLDQDAILLTMGVRL